MNEDASIEFLNDTSIPHILDNDQYVADVVELRFKAMLKQHIDGAAHGPKTVDKQQPTMRPTNG